MPVQHLMYSFHEPAGTMFPVHVVKCDPCCLVIEGDKAPCDFYNKRVERHGLRIALNDASKSGVSDNVVASC